MTDPTLHYIYDPLCGWCYAAEPLVEAAAAAGISVVLHGGGLWEPAIHATEAKRRSMRETDTRIGQLTGQPFGDAYLDGLLVDPASTWWSRPTIAAVLAADAVADGRGLAMIGAIQRAHYVEGRRVVDDIVLADAAGSIGLDRGHFLGALAAAPVDAHVAATRTLMRDRGLHGFPSFLLERGRAFMRLAHEDHYGRPGAFVAMIGQDARARDRRVGA